ncbi:MAG: hypothetical protein JWP87_5127 [Labilithrix sp.]|jgi:hypothetical protein|nr:hypothetical protein [Labilithrix sp.]
MRRKLLPRAVLAAILLALPAAADAPKNPPQYDRFDSDSVTIRDLRTKLEWDRNAIHPGGTLPIAFSYCATLGTLQSLGRLPSIKELLTILDEEPDTRYEFGHFVTKFIDAPAFGDAPVDLPYWSSTPAPGNKFWTLSFNTGLMEARASSENAHARCVR